MSVDVGDRAGSALGASLRRALVGGSPGPERPTLADVVIAVALAAVLLTTSLTSVAQSGLPTTWQLAVGAALVLLHVAVATGRRAPGAVLVVMSLAMLVLAASPDLGGPSAASVGGPYSALLLPSSLVYFVALYTASAHTSTPWPAVWLAMGLAGGAITVLRLWDAPNYTTSPLPGAVGWRLFVTAAVSAGVLAAWALGRYRATRIAWVATLEERAVQAELAHRAAIEQARLDVAAETARAAEAERRRIAREMHDVIAHSLAIVVSHAEAGRLASVKDPSHGPAALQTIADTGRQALREMRGLLGLLGDDPSSGAPSAPGESNGATETPSPGPEATGAREPAQRHTSGLSAHRAPAPTLDEVPALVEGVRATGARVTLEVTGEPRAVAATTSLAAHRIVQEALTNAVKHAGAGAEVRVRLDWQDDLLVVRVTSRGADGGRPAGEPGQGLRGMVERAVHVGGSLTAVPVGDGGFEVSATLPLNTAPPTSGDTT